MSGSFADAKVVKIENLQVVIVNAEPGATVNVNSGVESVQATGTTEARRGLQPNAVKLRIFRSP